MNEQYDEDSTYDAETEDRMAYMFPQSGPADEPLDARTERLAREAQDEDVQGHDWLQNLVEGVSGGQATVKGGSGISYDGHVAPAPRHVKNRDRKRFTP